MVNLSRSIGVMTNECKYCKSLLHFDSGAIAAEILAMRSGNSVVLEYQSVQETFLRLGLDFGEVPGSYSWPRRGARSVMLRSAALNGTDGSVCPRWNGRAARGTHPRREKRGTNRKSREN